MRDVRAMITLAAAIQLETLVDSSLPATRAYWRKKLGVSQYADDPRPLKDCVTDQVKQ